MQHIITFEAPKSLSSSQQFYKTYPTPSLQFVTIVMTTLHHQTWIDLKIHMRKITWLLKLLKTLRIATMCCCHLESFNLQEMNNKEEHMGLESNMMGASCTSLKELYYPIKISFMFFFSFGNITPKKNQIHIAILILTFFSFFSPKTMSCFANQITFLWKSTILLQVFQ